MRTPAQEALFKASGEQRLNKLESFIYVLLRDHVPAGVVAEVLADSLQAEVSECTNGFLAQYARWVARELS